MFEALQSSYSALHGEQKGLDWISMVMGNLEDAAALDSSYKDIFESVSNSFYQLEDAFVPYEMNWINWNLIHKD